MMNFSITENNLKMKKFTRSKNLSNLQDYMTPKKNPILSCLIDQLTLDLELRKRNSCQFTLLKGIIDSLKEGNIFWPSHFTLMLSEKWIQMMRTDSNFYWHHAGSSSEMKKYEDLLLNLAAQYLERQINLIPFLEENEISTFRHGNKTLNTTNQLQFNILSCQTLWNDNFFVSIFKK